MGSTWAVIAAVDAEWFGAMIDGGQSRNQTPPVESPAMTPVALATTAL
jgi:hypothetical protein